MTGCKHFKSLTKRADLTRGLNADMAANREVNGKCKGQISNACSASAVYAQGIDVSTESSYTLSDTILKFGLPETVRYRT